MLGRLTLVLVALTVIPPDRLSAQRVALVPQFVVGDYREQSADLAYRGIGFGAGAVARWRRLTGEVQYASVEYEPEDEGTGFQSFRASQLDGVLRYTLSGTASVEVGGTRRSIDPVVRAQSLSALRLGARLSQLLAPGARVTVRGTYLAAAKFSGGGSAPFAFEVGLGFLGELAQGHVRLTVDYEFQHLGRKTESVGEEFNVPIQQWLLRAGAGVAF
ncbi:MAG: hypothetical protein ACRD08_10320 [Acidimicrobiales bacterium]